MKKTFNILIILSIIAILFSCTKQDDFLNVKPSGEYSEDAVWSDPALVETFVNSMYREAMGFPLCATSLSSFVDESSFKFNWGVLDFNESLMTSDGLLGWTQSSWSAANSGHFLWEPLYENIRRTNIFFSKINSVSGNQATIDGLKGQVYFMRAWTYFYLTNLYGGVPIITKAYTLTDDFLVARSTYEECINYVVGQLDSALVHLPDVYATDGHITKGAVLAFKSRVLLYAASDLHNSAKNSVVTSGYSNPEFLGYVSGDATARWTAAKNAAKAVIELGKYSLYKQNPGPTDSVAENFVELFLSRQMTSEDILLEFTYNKAYNDWSGCRWGLYVGPNGYHNYGCNTPLGDLVDDYEMKDGSKFDWNNPVEKANPYINRDSRFYATILYEGVQWRKRPDDVSLTDPFSKIQTGSVYNTSGVLVKGGLDTQFGPIENWNAGTTGYYCRKFVDPSLDPQYDRQNIPFKQIRYAEILLNYAEACIELGGGTNENEARTYINMIRTRAGQPNLAVEITGDALRQAYRHECRIEFAYEDHRFWDVRRWLIGSAAYHQTSSVNVRYVTSEIAVDAYRKADGSTWSVPIFAKINTPGDNRAWDDKAYFFPIMRSEMNKNSKLIQNPRY